MNKVSLSKSRYCKAVQCYKQLWLDLNKPEEKEEIDNETVFENGNIVGDAARSLFGKHQEINFDIDLNKMIEDTKKALEEENTVVTEASFNYDNNFCSVDILVKTNDIYEIYEVKSSTSLHDIYLDDVSYQTYVLKSLGLNVIKSCVCYLNKDYIYKDKLDLKELFIIKDVTDIALSKQEEIISRIKEINSITKEPNIDIGQYCTSPYECPYFKYCTKNLPSLNIFNLRQMPNTTKFNLYHEGLISYEELLKSNIKPKYKEQIEFELYNKDTKINVKEINSFLDKLSYPLYFLDFETFQDPIPKYNGLKPYSQVPFQYSLHYILNEGGEVLHKEYLADGLNDPRRCLAEKLCEDIPLDVCIVAYNMTFEKTRIKELASMYPDLSKHLMNIHDNMVDLMIPFKDRAYYTKDMHGSFSIKYVLPALFPNDEKLNYHNLDEVQNGRDAMNAYQMLSKLNDEDKENLRKNMLKYCELDTYAMVKIWQKLKEIRKD